MCVRFKNIGNLGLVEGRRRVKPSYIWKAYVWLGEDIHEYERQRVRLRGKTPIKERD